MSAFFDPDSLVLDAHVSVGTAQTISRFAAICGASSLSFSAIAVVCNALSTIEVTISTFPEVKSFMIEHVSALASAKAELLIHEIPDLSQIRGLTSQKKPAVELITRVTKDINRQIEEITGNLLVVALLTSQPLPKNRSQRLLTVVNALKKDPSLNSGQLAELQKLQTRSRMELLEVLSLCLARSDKTHLRFNATLLIHLRSSLNSQHEDQQRSANLRRFFTRAETVDHVRALKESTKEGNLQALTTLVAFTLGLPHELTLDIPLAAGDQQPGLLAWLDASDGVIYVSTHLLLRELGQPTQGSKETQDVYQLRLPEFVVAELKIAYFANPTARTLSDIAETNNDRMQQGDDFWTDSTRGKLIRSAAVLSLEQRKNRVTTAYGFLSFHLLTGPDLHYLHVDQAQINQLRDEVFMAVGLGGTTTGLGPVDGAVGSKRTATVDTVRAVFEELDAAVSRIKIGRRYSPEALINYHNAYTHRVVMFVHLVAGGRSSSTLDFPASSWFAGSTFGFIDDKAVGASGGKTPIAITPLLCEQLRLWECHLLSLEQRLLKAFGTKASEARHRIKKIIGREESSIFFWLREDASLKEEVRAADLFVGTAQQLNKDWGRHLIASALVKDDATLAQVHIFLRHQGGAVNPHSAHGIDTPHDQLLHLAQRIDTFLKSIPLHPSPGLGGV